MVKVYIKERINDQTTICSGGVTGNTTYLGSKCSRQLLWGEGYLGTRYQVHGALVTQFVTVKYDFAVIDNLLFFVQFHAVFTVKVILTEENILFIFFKFLVVNTDFFHLVYQCTMIETVCKEVQKKTIQEVNKLKQLFSSLTLETK